MHPPSRFCSVQLDHLLVALHVACWQQGVAQLQAHALVLADWMQALGLVPAVPAPTPIPHKEN